MNTIDTEDTLGLSFCERLPLAFTHGQGSLVWDEAGKRYLDFTSGWGVTCLGHAHPVMLDAITRQAARLLQSPNAGFTYSPERAALLQLLRPLLPGTLSALYFCNSGAEANDAALKLARKVTGRSKVISTRGAFHGRSFNTLSVSRGPENSERYLPLLPAISFVPHGDIAALAREIDADTAAVIVEPIQGEGGVQIPPPDYLAQVQTLCRQHGALLIVDEVQTGFGRTGKLFALQHSAEPVQPDMLTLAKGIAGGFPFAAFAVTPEVRALLNKDDHGGTYCGNPLGCALAHAVISHLVEHEVPEQVAHKGRLLLDGLQTLLQRHAALLREVRGMGLLCALEFYDAALARELTLRCAEQGLLVVPTRNGIIRLLPDLLVSEADIACTLAILDGVLAQAVQ
jgi:acetylornithine/N-succinyldiaminopimelate aminotransferase